MHTDDLVAAPDPLADKVDAYSLLADDLDDPDEQRLSMDITSLRGLLDRRAAEPWRGGGGIDDAFNLRAELSYYEESDGVQSSKFSPYSHYRHESFYGIR